MTTGVAVIAGVVMTDWGAGESVTGGAGWEPQAASVSSVMVAEKTIPTGPASLLLVVVPLVIMPRVVVPFVTVLCLRCRMLGTVSGIEG